MNESGSASPWGPPASGSAPQPMLPPRPGSGPMSSPSLPSLPSSSPSAPPIGVPVGVPVAAPELSFDEPSAPPRRSRVAVGGILVGVLALGAAGVFAVSQMRSNSGGAASPEAVGAEFMAALEQEDVLGLIDLLLPGERDVFREPMVDLVSELSRLEVLSADATLTDLSGFEIEMTDEATAVEPTNVADISNITMSAKLTASIDGDQLPIGDLIRDLAGEQFDPSELDQPAVTDDFALPMTVVEADGRWYLSIFHTAAEAARGFVGEPIPETGLTPRGGSSPAGAMDVLLDGVEQLDLGKVIAAINPNEAAALQRYAPLFLDDAEQLADEVTLDWQVTQADYDIVGSGSKRFVTITALRIDGTAEGSAFSLELRDGCVVVDAEGERVDTCELGAGAQELPTSIDDFFGEDVDISELTTAYEEAFADYEQPGITVQEVNGEWFVSPLGSGFDQFLAVLRALDRDEIDRLVEVTSTFVGDLGDEFGGFFTDDFSLGPDDLSDVGADDGGQVSGDQDVFEFDDDAFDAEQEVAEQCRAIDDLTAAIQCMRDAVDDGTLPAYYLGVELEYPECGLADISLGRTVLFDLSDEDYTAVVQTASDCFTALIDAGSIDEYEISPEYLHPECGEGRNPWNFDNDDDEFFGRWADCISG